LSKLKQDEEAFVLRAQDQSAWILVHVWANINQAHLGPDHPKIQEARRIADRMREYPHQKPAD
jgi:hypothetical protein